MLDKEKRPLLLTDREKLAVAASIGRSLKMLKGGIEWDGDRKALESVQSQLRDQGVTVGY